MVLAVVLPDIVPSATLLGIDEALRKQSGAGRHVVARGDPSDGELRGIRAVMLPGDQLSIDQMPTSGQ
ncbi:hypothetical protein B7486_17520 [cyanobacterium TDX16]|nr:hypothetical protein B7486_17520 [cyanobacterium TDX16]